MKIKREIFDDLKSHLSKKEISVIVGPRQAGKTTVMQELRKYLQSQGERTLFLNLDWESDKLHFESQEALLKKIELELGKKKGYVFIDEVQRKENIGIFLKGIYDKSFPYKFIISGSGSIELKENIKESLIGRKRLFTLLPVSFKEFLNFKTDYKFENSEAKYLEIEKIKGETLLMEYLTYGGYPRVVTEVLTKDKIIQIDEIFKSYIEKDIVFLLRLDRPDAFSTLIKLLSSQLGRLVEYSNLAMNVSLSVPTIKKYLWYAEKTFIVKAISPFFKNAKKEIVKSRNIYFYDLGLRNYSIGIKVTDVRQDELGFLFQNFVLNLLEKKIELTPYSIKFWRTKDKAEVDFVVQASNEVIPIEVKYQEFNKMNLSMVPRSLRTFINKYSPWKAYIVNLNTHKEIQINSTVVEYIPYYYLLDNEFELF